MNCRACRDPYIFCHIFWITLLPPICPLAGKWFTILTLLDNPQNPNLGHSESLQEELCPWANCVLAHPHFLQHLVRAADVVGTSASGALSLGQSIKLFVPRTQSLVALAEETTHPLPICLVLHHWNATHGQCPHLWAAPCRHMPPSSD